MKTSSLTDRIRKVRVGVRAQQPLQYRIELVRSRSGKTGKENGLRMKGKFEQPN